METKRAPKRKERPGPGRPRDPKVDESIMRAAIELFSEYGEEGASLQQIAKRARVAATTLYRRWSSKEQLLVDAFVWLRTQEEEQVGAYDQMSAEQLASVMTEMTPDALGRSDLGKLVARLIGSVRSNPKLMEAYWNAHLLPRRKAFSRSLARMRDEGALPAESDPDVLQDMLVGALIYRFLVQPGTHTAQERRAYCRKLLKQLGFKVPGGR